MTYIYWFPPLSVIHLDRFTVGERRPGNARKMLWLSSQEPYSFVTFLGRNGGAVRPWPQLGDVFGHEATAVIDLDGNDSTSINQLWVRRCLPWNQMMAIHLFPQMPYSFFMEDMVVPKYFFEQAFIQLMCHMICFIHLMRHKKHMLMWQLMCMNFEGEVCLDHQDEVDSAGRLSPDWFLAIENPQTWLVYYYYKWWIQDDLDI